MSIINIDTHDVKCRDCALCIGRHIGEKDERERIIKLLESELGQGNPDFITERDTTIERLIALIKGENK